MKDTMQESSVNGFLKSTLTTCMDLLESKSGSIFLLDDKKQELILKIACNSRNKCLEDVRQKLGEGISGMVASKRESLLVKDIRKDPRFQNRRRFNHYRTYSFLSTPLLAGDKLIGVININEKNSGKTFTSKDLRLLFSISNYIASTINKTQLTQVYEKIEKSNWQLSEGLKSEGEEQNKLKKFASIGKLVAGMAHELNNPLDGAIRYINLSLNCLEEEGIVREYLLNAKKGLNRITNIIRSLLDFTQSSSPIFNRPIDINKTIEESLLMMSHQIISNNIKVIKEFNLQLPLMRDNGLRLVFSNIIKNACDAMPTGGTITVSTVMKNGYIEIRFSDTGPGVPKEIRNKIFEPFFTTKEMGKGAGLGLAMCYEIIQRHNGKIFLDKDKERGASFTIQLVMDKLNPVRNTDHLSKENKISNGVNRKGGQ